MHQLVLGSRWEGVGIRLVITAQGWGIRHEASSRGAGFDNGRWREEIKVSWDYNI